MPEKHSPLNGCLLALAAFALFALHDVVVKLLGAGYAVVQVVFFSVLLSFPLVVVMLLRDGEAGTLRPRHPWWSALRTASAVVTGLCIFFAFSTLPLTDVYAIIFTMPLVITVLSIPVLQERVGAHRWAAVVVGFLGVLIVLRPGTAALEPGHLAAMAGAFFAALTAVIVRKIGREERSAVLLLYPMVANFAAMAVALPFVYRPMPLGDLGLWALLAALSFGGSLLTIEAYRRSDAVLVAPMQYSQILWAALYGWLFFGDGVDAATAAGAAVIIASGLYVVWREGRGGSATTPVLRTRSRAETATVPRIGRLLSDAARDIPARASR